MNRSAPTTPVAEQQFDYAFDDIGNRQTTTRDLRQASYSVNSLNQYTSRTVPGFVNVLGTATNTATVSLWSQDNLALYTPTTRQGDYFRGEMLVNNNTGALWLTITNVAALSNDTGADIVTNTIGKTYVSKTPEMFYYDLDGNLTNDGRWVYTWDAENRLVKMESRSDAPALSKYKLEFTYDSKGRRIQKLVSTNNGSSYVAQYTNRFVYDGWNLVGILSPNSSLLSAYTWGLDLSGSVQGAGGVGGLLLCRDSGTSTTNCVAYDGNGNVGALVNVANGAVNAQYEYDPFLQVIRATGPLAHLMPFLGATKYYDWETGWYYYGYRYLRDGWWLSRDPMEEQGGNNVYCLVDNSPTQFVDALGLDAAQIEVGRAIIHYVENIIIGSPRIAAKSGVATGKLLGVLGKIKIVVDNAAVPPNATAAYQPLNDTMYLRAEPVSRRDATHEAVHAYNDIMRTSVASDARRDEGTAYGYTGLIEGPIYFAGALEKKITSAQSCPDQALIAGYWQKLIWGKFHRPESIASGSYGRPWPLKDKSFVTDATDMSNIKSIFGLHISCAEIAAIVNELLESRQCCYRVSCNKSSNDPAVIPAGVEIDPVFR